MEIYRIPLISEMQLIDRVVYAGDSAIPFGLPGVVVGIKCVLLSLFSPLFI